MLRLSPTKRISIFCMAVHFSLIGRNMENQPTKCTIKLAPFLCVHHHWIFKISPWLSAAVLISVPLILSKHSSKSGYLTYYCYVCIPRNALAFFALTFYPIFIGGTLLWFLLRHKSLGRPPQSKSLQPVPLHPSISINMPIVKPPILKCKKQLRPPSLPELLNTITIWDFSCTPGFKGQGEFGLHRIFGLVVGAFSLMLPAPLYL